MHTPIRTCIACRNKSSQNSLIKITKSIDGISVNDKYSFGRSCYVCKNEKCISIVVNKKMLDKKFKTTISKDLYELLTKQN